MNYYQAREIQKDGEPTGLFHFTKMNDGQIWPVGYCAKDCPGHEDPAEAAAHYHEYLLDNKISFGDDPDTGKRCAVCDRWTTGYGFLNGLRMFHLCPTHQTRAAIASLTTPSTEIVSSW